MSILLRGGVLYDGTGAGPLEADLLIEGDRISAIGPDLHVPEAEIFDVRGKVVSPGFIDIHRHGDVEVFSDSDFGLIELSQGITTAVFGNCGMAPVPCDPRWRDEAYSYLRPILGAISEGLPFEDYVQYTQALESLDLPINLGFLAGAGAVKTALKGFSRKPFTPPESAAAVKYIEQAMETGALGLSFGLMYQPECFSSREELVTLARAADKGFLSTHIRNEGDNLVDSVEEVIDIARKAELPLNISHFKATGIQNWGTEIYRAIDVIENARARGQPVAVDFYPYSAGSTTLQSLLPPTMLEDSIDVMLSNLAAPGGLDKLRRELYKSHPGWDNMALSIGWDRIVIGAVSLPEYAEYTGENMENLARRFGHADPACLLGELLIREKGRTGIIVLSMSPDDVDAIARLPWSAVISDALYGGDRHPHPRLCGAFPKFLRDYVRERRILSFQEGIHKMTGMPAERAGISGRGKLQPGYFADILVFDPLEFTDHADYQHPLHRSGGLDMVLINGSVVWRQEALLVRKGRLVRRV
jgi:N-acyl-D-aspartate/D-glutamate deacylase